MAHVSRAPVLKQNTDVNKGLEVTERFTVSVSIGLDKLQSKHPYGAHALIQDIILNSLHDKGYTSIAISFDTLALTISISDYKTNTVYKCWIPPTLVKFISTYNRYTQGHYYVRQLQRTFYLQCKPVDKFHLEKHRSK